MLGIGALVAIIVAVFVFIMVLILIVSLCICWNQNWYKLTKKPNGEDVEKKHMVSTQFSRSVGGHQMNQVILKSHPNGTTERKTESEMPYKTIDTTTHTYRYETDVKNSTKGDSGVAGSPASSREADQSDIHVAVAVITTHQEPAERQETPPPQRAAVHQERSPSPQILVSQEPPARPETPPPQEVIPVYQESPEVQVRHRTPTPPPIESSPEVHVHIRDELKTEGQVNAAADLSSLSDDDNGPYSKPYSTIPPAPESRPPPLTPGTPPDTPTEGAMPTFPPPSPVATTSQEHEIEDLYARVNKTQSASSTFKPDQDTATNQWRFYGIREANEIQIIEK